MIQFNGWSLYLWPGSGGSCFSSLATADSFGLGRGISSASFAGVEAGFDIRSSSRLLWLQTKIDVFVQCIFRKEIHEIINSVFWRCRAWRQPESFKATTSWLHATTPRPLNTKPWLYEISSWLQWTRTGWKKKKQVKRTARVWGCILVLKVTTLSFHSFVLYF